MKRALAIVALVAAAAPVRADELSSAAILGPPKPYAIESVMTRYTHMDQNGHGYQSQAGPDVFPRVPVGQPGSEWLVLDQAQVEIVARQGENLVHRLWVPVDIISNASADALDAISTASRHIQSGSIELASNWQANRNDNLGISGGMHLEAQFRSWNVGVSWARAFADDNAVFAASLNEVYDWFDQFDVNGLRNGRIARNSINASLGITQLLSATTVAHLDYGYTLQSGTLGNTWNAVPLANGTIDGELLPAIRQRHAVMARLAQWLPWRGALHLAYRFYADDWGAIAHTVEGIVYQRVAPWLYLGATYRVHQQSGVSFFTTLASPTAPLRSADSDLAPLVAQTVGGSMAVDVPLPRRVRALHLDFAYEHYWRSNDLAVDVYSVGAGVLF